MSWPPYLETKLVAPRFTSENDRHILCALRNLPSSDALEEGRRRADARPEEVS